MRKYSLREKLETNLEEHSEILKNLLASRGITDKESADNFISPDYEDGTHDPFLMKDMDKAVRRFLKAIDSGERIVVYSDFDADGIPGGALFHDFLKKIGYKNFVNYIPHRNDEGYGLHLEAIEDFHKDGTGLIITIDVGIAAYEEIKKAQELGMSVIVTDHHEPNGQVLDAVAVLDPKQDRCSYPFKELCGTAVAYKFIQAIISKRDFGIKAGMEKWWLDLVGIATLSDMVPLVGENRVFAYYGLMVLRKSSRPGIMQATRSLKIDQKHINEDDIGFLITPRINAASRMGHPDDAFALLTAEDEPTAGAAMQHLSKINDERKGLVASIAREVKKKLKKRADIGSVIVSGDPRWKPSVLGLVANKLMEEYDRPVFLWGRENGGNLKGSSRSNNLSLIEIMNNTADSFTHFGGHTKAAGFAVCEDKIHALEESLCKAHDSLKKVGTGDAPIWIDADIEPEDLKTVLFETVAGLAPFGVGNPKPLFRIKNVIPDSIRLFGKQNNHLEISFGKIKAIGFFMTEDSFEVKPKVGSKINLLAHLEESFFRGRKERRLRIVDIV